MKSYYLFFFIFISLQVQSQSKTIRIDKTGDVHPWSHLELNNNPDNFQFAIVSDRTGGHREGVFEDAVKKLNLLQPEFVMSVGDLIEGYTRDEDEIYRQWDEFNRFIGKLQMPFFYVPGNHDYINDVMAKIWEDKYGKSYFHFIYKDVLFLGLNSEEATKGSNMGGIEKEQFNYIKKTLKENEEVNWTLVFMHQPLWILDNTRYWPEVEKLLADRKHTVFVGHHHHYVKYQRNNGKYFMLATTGGASKLRGPDQGEFDHVVWVTMTEEGPIIANLLLEGIWDENVVNEEITGLVSKSPLKIEPLLVDSEFFSKGKMELKMVNDANSTMNYKIIIENGENLLADKNIISGSVPPNNVELFYVDLSTKNNTAGKNFESVKLMAEYEFLYEGERNIIINQNYNFAPTILNKLDFKTPPGTSPEINEEEHFFKVDSNYYVDGDIDSYNGNEDASFEFSTNYSEEFLNISVKVRDDEILIDPEKSVWRQDAIRIYIDPRPARISASGKEQNNGYDYLGIFFSPAKTNKDELTVYQKDLFPENTKLTASYDDSFLYYDISVPLKWINKMAGGSWKHLRLNVALTDADFNGSVTTLFWQPEWRSEANIIGSGIFRKELLNQ